MATPEWAEVSRVPANRGENLPRKAGLTMKAAKEKGGFCCQVPPNPNAKRGLTRQDF